MSAVNAALPSTNHRLLASAAAGCSGARPVYSALMDNVAVR